MKYTSYSIILFIIALSLSCASYKFNQMQDVDFFESEKIIWSYPTFAYSYIKADAPKEIRNKIDSVFYATIKEELSIIPQDSFYQLTHKLRNNDSVSVSLKRILKKLNDHGVSFILYPEYYNFFNRTLKGKGGFKIIIGKGISSKPTKFEVVDSTSFFLGVTLAYLDSEEKINTKIIKTELPTTYIGRRNKYLPGEPDSFKAFELEAINNMTLKIRDELKKYINEVNIQNNVYK